MLLSPDLSKFDNCLNGSTYIHFDDFMLTQSILVGHSSLIIVLIDYHNSGNNTDPAQYDAVEIGQGLFMYTRLWISKYLAFLLLLFQGSISIKETRICYG